MSLDEIDFLGMMTRRYIDDPIKKYFDRKRRRYVGRKIVGDPSLGSVPRCGVVTIPVYENDPTVTTVTIPFQELWDLVCERHPELGPDSHYPRSCFRVGCVGITSVLVGERLNATKQCHKNCYWTLNRAKDERDKWENEGKCKKRKCHIYGFSYVPDPNRPGRPTKGPDGEVIWGTADPTHDYDFGFYDVEHDFFVHATGAESSPGRCGLISTPAGFLKQGWITIYCVVCGGGLRDLKDGAPNIQGAGEE
jgi:hypothetical protein